MATKTTRKNFLKTTIYMHVYKSNFENTVVGSLKERKTNLEDDLIKFSLHISH